jgi:hypothetical protein
VLGTPPDGTSHVVPPQRREYPSVSRRLAGVDDDEVWVSLVVDVDVHAAMRSKTRMPVEDRGPIHSV